MKILKWVLILGAIGFVGYWAEKILSVLAVLQMKLLFPFAKRFIAGYDFASAIPIIQKLMDDGYKVSVDYLGELSKTEEDCERAYQQYLEIVDYYKNSKINVESRRQFFPR